MTTALVMLALAPLTLTQATHGSSSAGHASSAPAHATATSARPAAPTHFPRTSHGSQPVGAQAHQAVPARAQDTSHPSAPVATDHHGRQHDGSGPRAPGVQAVPQTQYVENGVIVEYGPSVDATDVSQISMDGSEQPTDATPPPDYSNDPAVTTQDDPNAPQSITVDDGSGQEPVIYRWTDDDGVVHYSSAELVPESARSGAVPTNGDPINVTHTEQAPGN